MEMDYDTYLANQVEEHMRERLFYSDCCDEEMDWEDSICPRCHEHCTAISEEDREYDRLCEIADEKHEQQKDENNEL